MKTTVKSKRRIFGEVLRAGELVQALQNACFKDPSAPVQINTPEHTDFLKMVYRCPSCNNLHLCCGELDREGFSDATADLNVLGEHYSDDSLMSQRELCALLEALPASTPIAIEHTEESGSYKLTEVCCLGEADGVALLDCAYETNLIRLN